MREVASDDSSNVSCAEVRGTPIDMADADRSIVLSHVLTCDSCRGCLAERTCD